MVSSRWTCGESPSPFVLTLALMPPCAHTEWERLTGTSEKRLTGTPSSQSLITVIRPASPPPTTMTRRAAPVSLRVSDVVEVIARGAKQRRKHGACQLVLRRGALSRTARVGRRARLRGRLLRGRRAEQPRARRVKYDSR